MHWAVSGGQWAQQAAATAVAAWGGVCRPHCKWQGYEIREVKDEGKVVKRDTQKSVLT